MTHHKKLFSNLSEKYILTKNNYHNFIKKANSLSYNAMVINSTRAAIIAATLYMGYVHTPKEKKDLSNFSISELMVKAIDPIIERTY